MTDLTENERKGSVRNVNIEGIDTPDEKLSKSKMDNLALKQFILVELGRIK